MGMLPKGLDLLNADPGPYGLLPLVILLIGIIWVQRRRYRQSLQNQYLHANFDGKLPPAEIKALQRQVQVSLEKKPRDQVLTVMFIDIAGFSRVAEGQNPQLLFRNVNSHVRFISRLVHKHGGVIDKFLGDGILCYFGFSVSGQVDRSHANRALKCAIAIQRENLKRCQKAMAHGKPIYPVRIGLNSGSVLVGDLGRGHRIDLTMIGHTVNFAKRMEQCSETFKILMSATTKELLQDFNVASPCVNKKSIQLKHYEGLKEAYEYNPLMAKADIVTKAVRYFRDSVGIVRKEERIKLRGHKDVAIYTDHGEGQLLDHSFSGIGITLHKYLAQGCELNLRLDSNHQLSQILGRYGIFEIKGEIRWARPKPGGQAYEHGIAIRNLTRKQLGILHSILTNYRDFEPRRADLLPAG